MIYLLVNLFHTWLAAHRLGFLRLFQDVTFQTTLATLMSFVIVIFCGPRTIAWLRSKKIGDKPSFDQPQIDQLMVGKKGTPTMGGILIIASIAVTVLLLADLNNFYVRMALVTLIWLGGVGAVDDWLKLTNKGSIANRQGLTTLEKLLFQVGLAILLSVFTYRYSNYEEPHPVFPVLQASASDSAAVGLHRDGNHRPHRQQQRGEPDRRPGRTCRRMYGHRQLRVRGAGTDRRER